MGGRVCDDFSKIQKKKNSYPPKMRQKFSSPTPRKNTQKNSLYPQNIKYIFVPSEFALVKRLQSGQHCYEERVNNILC